jgi:hypothetical protein
VNGTFGFDSQRYYGWKKQLKQTGSLEYRSPKEHCGKINILPTKQRVASTLAYAVLPDVGSICKAR